MEWRDDGFVISARPHGETATILEAMTAAHGRRLGLVHGGASRKKAGIREPGAQVSLHWRARAEGQLGTFRAEPVQSRAGALFDDPLALAALSAACALIGAFTPERAPMPRLYQATAALLDQIASGADWMGAYAEWELTLLEEIGYGLDLATCAATGTAQELIYVSPRSGRAVSRAAGAPYADKLLPLPAPLRLGGPATAAEFAASLRVTGHFLDAWARPGLGLDRAPAARERLAALAQKRAPEP